MWRSSGDNRTYRIPYVATVPERNLRMPYVVLVLVCRSPSVRSYTRTSSAFGDNPVTVCVGYAFGMRSGCLLPAACLPACTQAGSGNSYQYGTSYHEYSYSISRTRTRGRSYGTVGAAMRPRCGDPPNKVCTAQYAEQPCTPIVALYPIYRSCPHCSSPIYRRSSLDHTP